MRHVTYRLNLGKLAYFIIISGSMPAGTQIFSLFQCKLKTSRLLLSNDFYIHKRVKNLPSFAQLSEQYRRFL